MAKRPDVTPQNGVKQFLRERNLTRSFNKCKSIKAKKKRIIEVSYSNYDGTSRRGRVYVFRQNNKTVFRDFNTLNIVGRSKKKLGQAIKAAFTRTRIQKSIEVRGWNVTHQNKEPELKLKNVSKQQSYNAALQRLRTVERRNTTKRKTQGMIVTDLTYVSKGGGRKRIQIRSKMAFLNNKNTRDKLIAENISNGSGLAGFSPIDVIINGIWFEYWSDKREKLKRIR